jgi:hypothetical protein
MSLYDKASLIQIPSGYKAADDKLYSIVPSNGDGDFTIDSDADATRVNKNGLVEAVAANQARLDYNPSNPQDPILLLERTRNNFNTNSENFSSGYSTVGSPVSEENNLTSPNGGINAAKQTIATTGNGYYKFPTTVTSGTDYTVSAFFKYISGSGEVVRFGAAGGTFGGDQLNRINIKTGVVEFTNTGNTVVVEEYPNEWYRVSCTKDATSNGTGGFSMFTNADDMVFGWWGVQFEAGSYPSSYIPTTIAVTRTEDFISNSYTGLTSTSGTIFIDFDTKGFDLSFSKIIALRDTATGDSLRLEPFDNSGTKKFAFFGINGSSATPPSEDILPINNRKKIALTFDSGNFKYASDGVITTGTYSGTARQYNQIGGANITGGAMHNAIIHQFMVFDEALTDAELTTLTT